MSGVYVINSIMPKILYSFHKLSLNDLDAWLETTINHGESRGV